MSMGHNIFAKIREVVHQGQTLSLYTGETLPVSGNLSVTGDTALIGTTTLTGTTTAAGTFNFTGSGTQVGIANTLGLAVGGTGITSTARIVSTSTTQGVGYATGAGGTVTQGTNWQTAVSINKPCGEIVLHTTFSLAANTETSFAVDNTMVDATDVVIVHVKVQPTQATLMAYVSAVTTDQFTITLSNLDASTAITAGNPKLSFAVIKAVAA